MTKEQDRLQIEYSPEHRAYLQMLRRKDRFVTAMRYLLLVAFILFWELAAR